MECDYHFDPRNIKPKDVPDKFVADLAQELRAVPLDELIEMREAELSPCTWVRALANYDHALMPDYVVNACHVVLDQVSALLAAVRIVIAEKEQEEEGDE